MPTSDIIGYLWQKRQDLDLYSLPDVLDMVANLQRLGLDCVRAEDTIIFGVPAGASIQFVRLEIEEWDRLVHAALLDAAVQNAIHMSDLGGDGE